MGVIVTEEFGFDGDGQLLAPWGSLLDGAGLPPTMIVGIDRTADPDEMARIREYSPSFAPEVFAAHGPLPRCYLVAGTREPFFLANATRWAGALRDAGGEVRLEERDGGHGDPFWAAEFPRMIGWAFGR